MREPNTTYVIIAYTPNGWQKYDTATLNTQPQAESVASRLAREGIATRIIQRIETYKEIKP